MNREYPDRPFIGVGAVIIDNARVLLVKRGHEPLTGEWSIPGGVLELGETVRQGVAREALEETGLTVEPLELLGVFDRVVRDVDEARWFSAEELAKLPLAKDTAEVIQSALSKAAD